MSKRRWRPRRPVTPNVGLRASFSQWFIEERVCLTSQGLAMPLFFLNIKYDDGSLCPDQDGGEYANFEAASSDARRSLKALIADVISFDKARAPISICIVDQLGATVGEVRISDVVPLTIARALGVVIPSSRAPGS